MNHTVDLDPCSAAISIFHINSRSFKKFKAIALANGKNIKFFMKNVKVWFIKKFDTCKG